MAKYRKKPIVVEAVQLQYQLTTELVKLLGEDKRNISWMYNNRTGRLTISTLEGIMQAYPGDVIIKGVAGEFYPCKADIFRETYEEV